MRNEMHAFLGGAIKTLECQPVRIGGAADHVHLLNTLSRKLAIASFVKEIKRVSTQWIRRRSGIYSKFQWQAGYAAFSVSPSLVDEVGRYIDNQESHHRKVTFQEELRTFLKRHEIEFDERFVWD